MTDSSSSPIGFHGGDEREGGTVLRDGEGQAGPVRVDGQADGVVQHGRAAHVAQPGGHRDAIRHSSGRCVREGWSWARKRGRCTVPRRSREWRTHFGKLHRVLDDGKPLFSSSTLTPALVEGTSPPSPSWSRMKLRYN